MSEFKKPKVNPDKAIFLELDGWYKWVEECKEPTAWYWTDSLREHWSRQLDGWTWEQKGRLNQELKSSKNRGDQPGGCARTSQAGYGEPQRHFYTAVKRCWPLSRAGVRRESGTEKISTFPPYFVIWGVEERGMWGNTFLRAKWISIKVRKRKEDPENMKKWRSLFPMGQGFWK